MSVRNYVSPTGHAIVGTLETLSGKALILGIGDDGEPEYAGDTEIYWDEQKTVERDGKPLFLDEEGGEWTFDQLTPEAEDEEDEPEPEDNSTGSAQP